MIITKIPPTCSAFSCILCLARELPQSILEGDGMAGVVTLGREIDQTHTGRSLHWLTATQVAWDSSQQAE